MSGFDEDFRLAEEAAANFLRERGHRILAANYSVPRRGELDLLSFCRGKIYATEVKAGFCWNEERLRAAFNPRKRRRCVSALKHYLYEQGQSERGTELLAAAVLWDKRHHIKDISVFNFDG